MTPIATFLTRLPDSWKALTALGGAVAFGAALTFFLGGFRDLPARVDAQERRLSEVEAVARRVEGQYGRLVCLLTLPDSLNGIEAERACP